MPKTNRILFLTFLLITCFFINTNFVNAETSPVIINDGDLVKSTNGFAIYLISGTSKKVFPHISVYQSWGYPEDFSTIKTIPAEKLENYTEGEAISFRDGALFGGTTSSLYGKESSAVFAVSGGKLRAIKSSNIYQDLYNDPSWSRVTWVPDDLLSKFQYPLGDMVESSDTPLDGSLIRYTDSNTTYLIKDGKKKSISSDVFSINRLRERDVIISNVSEEQSGISTDTKSITTINNYLINPTYSSLFEGNQKPVIENLLWKQLDNPQDNWSAYELTVNADDIDGNIPITYEWSIDCGYFSGDTNEQNVVWHYSNTTGCQDAWATITVTDSEGLSSTKTQNVFSLVTLSDKKEDKQTENAFKITIANLEVKQGTTFTIPVLTSLLSKEDNIIAYQFNLSFDSDKLEYLGYERSGTLSEKGMIAVNAREKGFIRVAYATAYPIIGEGAIINFNFKALLLSETDITLSDFQYNVNSISNISKGIVIIREEIINDGSAVD